jgi:hypothetical protein
MMPRAAKTPKVDPDAVYVAVDSFAAEVAELGHAITVQRGQRLAGSNPVVRERPYYFVLDGAAAEEIQAARIALTPAATETSESVERRKRNSVAQLRQAVLDRAVQQARLDQADEYVATSKRKAEGEGADKREIEKALRAEVDQVNRGRGIGSSA